MHVLVAAMAGSAVTDELSAVVADRTDGNPFFVIELVRFLESEGTLTPEAAREMSVPHGVQDVLRLRMARFPDALSGLLAIASVGGREFQLDQVATVAGVEPDIAMELLDLAVEARIVEEHDVARSLPVHPRVGARDPLRRSEPHPPWPAARFVGTRCSSAISQRNRT